MARLSGNDFDIEVGGMKLNVQTISLAIEDGRTVAYDNGHPNGFVNGNFAASGDLELDWENFSILKDSMGDSWQSIEPLDILFFAKPETVDIKIEAFGCLLRISDLLNIDSKGGEKSTVKIGFDVTAKEFVKIDGKPYISPAQTARLQVSL